jgi:serine/threonine-protein kinase
MSPLPEAEAYARHKWAAERALALDDRSADAHTSFAISLWWQRNWPGAERELRRALELNPGSVPTHYWYALLLGGEGRLEDARRETQVAASLDPFALIAQQNAGWACYLQRDYACGIKQFGRAVELNGAWANAHNMLSLCYAFTGRHADAEREAMAALALQPRNGRLMADLSIVHASAGRMGEARQDLRRAIALKAPPSTIARAYVVLGQRDSAFAWLERVDWTWPHRQTRFDPALAPLRDDPRFARLVARVDHEMGLR